MHDFIYNVDTTAQSQKQLFEGALYKKFIFIITDIAVFHATGHGWGENLQSLAYDGPRLDSVGLEQTVEHLQHIQRVTSKQT